MDFLMKMVFLGMDSIKVGGLVDGVLLFVEGGGEVELVAVGAVVDAEAGGAFFEAVFFVAVGVGVGGVAALPVAGFEVFLVTVGGSGFGVAVVVDVLSGVERRFGDEVGLSSQGVEDVEDGGLSFLFTAGHGGGGGRAEGLRMKAEGFVNGVKKSV